MEQDWSTSDKLQAIYAEMMRVATSFRLPITNRTWRGQIGNWLGSGAGSSIDFKDHRPYAFGDDIRYINWQAYARTGQYTMKLYSEEVRPVIDLVLDISPSMFFEDKKAVRTLEIFYFCISSAIQLGLSIHAYTILGSIWVQKSLESILSGTWLTKSKPKNLHVSPKLADIPWKSASMRIFISDFLFPNSHHEILISLTKNHGTALLYIPYCMSETHPTWNGNVELIECETQETKNLYFNGPKRIRYGEAYGRHFENWRESCQKFTVGYARISSETNFIQGLQEEAIPSGMVNV